MRRFRIALGSMAVAAAFASGCDTAPPGGGLTNGPAPDLSAEKPAIRTDGPDRDRTDQGEMKGAAGEASLPTAGGEKDSGAGGKGAARGEAAPAKPADHDRHPGPRAPKDGHRPRPQQRRRRHQAVGRHQGRDAQVAPVIPPPGA